MGLIGTNFWEEPAVPVFTVDQIKCYHFPYDIALWKTVFIVQLIVAASGTMIFRNVAKY